MRCPGCANDDTRVTDSRPTESGRTKRRRRCEGCGLRFRTYEVVEPGRLSLITPLGIVSALDDDAFVDAVAGHARAAARKALRNVKAAAETDDGDEPASTQGERRCAS